MMREGYYNPNPKTNNTKIQLSSSDINFYSTEKIYLSWEIL